MIPTKHLENLIAFVQREYFEKLYEIVRLPDEHKYFDLKFDLLAFLYEFPQIGEHFYEWPQEFNEFLQLLFKHV